MVGCRGHSSSFIRTPFELRIRDHSKEVGVGMSCMFRKHVEQESFVICIIGRWVHQLVTFRGASNKSVNWKSAFELLDSQSLKSQTSMGVSLTQGYKIAHWCSEKPNG